jgi:hypothetical protein
MPLALRALQGLCPGRVGNLSKARGNGFGCALVFEKVRDGAVANAARLAGEIVEVLRSFREKAAA